MLREVLKLRTGVKVLSNKSTEDLLECLSLPETQMEIEDLVEVSHLYQIKESPLALLDVAVSLLERIPELSDTRLVVWLHEFQTIAQISSGDLLLKRLRVFFQHQTHVSFSFTGSEPELMKTLFADRFQAFYRFAVIMQFPESAGLGRLAHNEYGSDGFPS